MAIEFFSGNGGDPMSPRISFSHDFCQLNVIPVEQHPFRSNSSGLNSSIDFDFCVHESFDQESSLADELFSDGRILPTEIKKKNCPSKQTGKLAPQSPSPPSDAVRDNVSTTKISKRESLKECKYVSDEVDDKQGYMSFWRLKRSSSCGSGYGRSLCPLPLLSRSYSTGSTPCVKRLPLSKEGKNAQKHPPTRSSLSLGPNSYQKPPLKKCQGSYVNGVGVNPVILLQIYLDWVQFSPKIEIRQRGSNLQWVLLQVTVTLICQ